MTTQQASDIFSAIVEAPFGAVGVRTSGDLVRELVYLPPQFHEKAPQDGAAEQAARQVARYLADPDFAFDLPLAPAGTDFQRRVWDTICAIARGSVRTYGQVGRLVGCKAPRAIGQACGANPFPLIIPCHRVTAAGGLGGFSNHDDENGFHLAAKRWLLRHEGVNLSPWQQQAIWP